MIDLDQPICEGCRKPLAVIDHADDDDTIVPGKLNRWPDGTACRSTTATRTRPSARRPTVDSVEELARELAGREGFGFKVGMVLDDGAVVCRARDGGITIDNAIANVHPYIPPVALSSKAGHARTFDEVFSSRGRPHLERWSAEDLRTNDVLPDIRHPSTVGAIEGEIRRICHELEWEVIFRDAPGEGCIINLDDGRRVVRRFTVIEEPARGIVAAKALIFLLDRHRQKKS